MLSPGREDPFGQTSSLPARDQRLRLTVTVGRNPGNAVATPYPDGPRIAGSHVPHQPTDISREESGDWSDRRSEGEKGDSYPSTDLTPLHQRRLSGSPISSLCATPASTARAPHSIHSSAAATAPARALPPGCGYAGPAISTVPTSVATLPIRGSSTNIPPTTSPAAAAAPSAGCVSPDGGGTSSCPTGNGNARVPGDRGDGRPAATTRGLRGGSIKGDLTCEQWRHFMIEGGRARARATRRQRQAAVAAAAMSTGAGTAGTAGGHPSRGSCLPRYEAHVTTTTTRTV